MENIPVYALASVIVIAEEFGRDRKTQSSTLYRASPQDR
jgi:hypothetical protein